MRNHNLGQAQEAVRGLVVGTVQDMLAEDIRVEDTLAIRGTDGTFRRGDRIVCHLVALEDV
jgi:hypothetical protein